MRRAFWLLLACAPLSAQDHSHHHGHAGNNGMTGLLGSYPMTRDASGTAWGPEAAPHEGIHVTKGEWMIMTHGYVNAIYDRQSGPRGSEMGFSQSMLMAMARREAGPGVLGLKSMLSLEPLMGKRGYPLLLQAGETADGRATLVDRQHPHDLFMELAASYSLPIGDQASAFAYAGLPGEPALGPPAFMHRFSGADNPEAPLSHHWLDSTHIVFGVLTGGFVWKDLKLELSGFRGREPDQHRWDMEAGGLDSFSTRVTWNPTRHWSLQTSYGSIESPEQLHPHDNVGRLTASASFHTRLKDAEWQTTGAWGRNKEGHGEAENAYLLESAFVLEKKHTVFSRLEGLQRHDLFEAGHPKHGRRFFVGKISAGYIRDFHEWRRVRLGAGGALGFILIPPSLREDYGNAPTSVMLFLRAKLG